MSLAVFTLAVGLGCPSTAPPQPPRPFTNITEPSGVGAVVEAHYARVPDWWLSGIDLVDFDGDGDLDLHLGGHGSPAAAATNDGRGHFTYVDPRLAVPRGVRHHDDIPYPGGEIRLAFDFNEDDKTDVLGSWHDGGGVLYRNDCRGGDPPEWNFRRPGTLDQFNRSAAMADVDRDGIVDYLADAGGRADPQILILFGKGDATFERKQLVSGSLEEGGPICVDIDADGDLDFLVTRRGYNPPGRRILRNDGELRFTDVTSEAGLTETDGSIHGAGDLDQDGDLDLICIEGTKPPFHLAVYMNDGKGRFHRKSGAIAGAEKLRLSSANWGGAVVTDLDNNAVPDVIVNGRYFLSVLRGKGDGEFVLANEDWGLPAGAWSAVDEGLCFGDVDSDGDLDVITCGREGTKGRKTVEVFRNDLPPQGWLRVRPVGAKGNHSAAGAKIRIYEAGGLGDPKRLLWFEQIAVWGRQSFHSYYAHTLTERHFGLGGRTAVDLAVEFYPSQKRLERTSVESNMTVVVREE